MFAGASGEFAFEEKVSDGMALGDLFEDLSEAFEGSDLGDGAAENLLSGKAEGFALTVVDAEVAEFDGVEEGEADGGGLVDGFEFGALALGLVLAALEGLGEGLAIVDVDGDAEPVEDFAGVVADGLGPNPPPAGTAIAGANHAGFDVVVLPGDETERDQDSRTRSRSSWWKASSHPWAARSSMARPR